MYHSGNTFQINVPSKNLLVFSIFSKIIELKGNFDNTKKDMGKLIIGN